MVLINLLNVISYGAQKLIFAKGLSEILIRPDNPSLGPIEQAVFTRQHDDRRLFESLVILDQGTGLIAIQVAAS